jgi:hypothetical protein
VVISDWKHDYNHHRRHSAPGLPTARPLRRQLHPPMNDARPLRSCLRVPAIGETYGRQPVMVRST